MSATLAEVIGNPAVQAMPVHMLRSGVKTELASRHFPSFIRQAWRVVEPGQPYIHNWHIDLIAEYLTAVDLGQIQHLAINIPPRHSKSLLVTVLWPVWSWMQNPVTKWMFWSYSDDLMTEHSVKRRTIIESDWFRDRWGDIVQLRHDQNQKTKYENTAAGVMDSTVSKTGKGGSRLVIDDPQNPEQAHSDAQRAATLRYFDLTLSTRLNNPKTDPTVIVMQRLAEDDVTGHAIEQGYTVVKVPSIAEKPERIVFPVSKREIERQEGDLLWPERFSAAVIDRAKISLGPRGFAAQHQQEPAVSGGNILKEEWWKFEDPELIPVVTKAARRIIQLWDTAHKTGQENDWSVCATWADVGKGVQGIEPGYYLVDLWRGRVEFPELEEVAPQQYRAWRRPKLVIEEAASGISLVQSLRARKIPVETYKPDRDKVARVNAISGYVKAGFCHLFVSASERRLVMSARSEGDVQRLPAHLQAIAAFLHEHRLFPVAKHDDTVDTTSMMLLYTEVNPPDKPRGYLATGIARGGWGGSGS